jgi:uracil-DNA glycosylase
MRDFMDVLKDIAVELDENRIAAMLKCGPNQREEMLELIRQQINICRPLLKPQIAFERVNINAVEADRVTIENGIVFKAGDR